MRETLLLLLSAPISSKRPTAWLAGDASEGEKKKMMMTVLHRFRLFLRGAGRGERVFQRCEKQISKLGTKIGDRGEDSWEGALTRGVFRRAFAAEIHV